MRRDNLFLPLRSGGVGLVHLFVHQLISRFFFIKTADHPFVKVFIQHKLSAHLPFLFAPTHPANPRPLWGFLKEVADTFKFLIVRFSLEYLYSFSRKELTGILFESLFPVPIYCQPYLMFLDDSALKRVKKMCIQAAAKTFFFKLHTSTLPVQTWLNSKGVYVPWSVNCRLCNQPETIDHCFVLCRDAVFFFYVLQRTLKKDIDITPYSIRCLPVMKNCSVPYDLFVLIGLFSLWKCRMIDRHAEEPRETKSIFANNCLRCNGEGHVRRECKVSRCSLCRRFGHAEAQCTRSYASAVGPPGDDDASEHLMDAEEAEEAAKGTGDQEKTEEEATTSTNACEAIAAAGGGDNDVPEQAPAPTDDLSKDGGTRTNAQATVNYAPDAMDVLGNPVTKRCHIDVAEGGVSDPAVQADEPPMKTAPGRRSTTRLKPSVAVERRSVEASGASQKQLDDPGPKRVA
ncbi:uncharacterized protein LOC144158707 [Haemaphysalis longicornis]